MSFDYIIGVIVQYIKEFNAISEMIDGGLIAGYLMLIFFASREIRSYFPLFLALKKAKWQ